MTVNHDNDKENRKLLYRYLIKYLIDEKGHKRNSAINIARGMIYKHKNNLWGKGGLASWLGRRSIEFFCLYYLQDTFAPKPNNTARPLADFHYEIWDELKSMFIDDKYDRLELVMPRGASKTTTCDFALTVWVHCYKKSIYTLVAGKTEQNAIEFIRETRRAFEENEYIKRSFGELIDTKNYTVNKLARVYELQE